MRSNVHPPRGVIPGTAAALLASSVRSFHQPHCVRWRGSLMCLMLVFFFFSRPPPFVMCRFSCGTGQPESVIALTDLSSALRFRCLCRLFTALRWAVFSPESLLANLPLASLFFFVLCCLIPGWNACKRIYKIPSNQLHTRWSWIGWKNLEGQGC